jgi:outer membrane protein OmpA-like peptidoglycan-associated protein
MGVATVLGSTASAQIIIGGEVNPRPPVVVDLSVLDGVGESAAIVPATTRAAPAPAPAAARITPVATQPFTPPPPRRRPEPPAPAQPPVPDSWPEPPAAAAPDQAPPAPAVPEAPSEPPPAPDIPVPRVAPPPPTAGDTPEAPPDFEPIPVEKPPAPPEVEQDPLPPGPQPSGRTEEGAAPEAAPKPEPAPQETAPLPDNGEDGGESVDMLPEGGFTISFDPGSEELNDSGGRLLTGLAQRMLENDRLRLEVRAYAGGTPETASQARRLSLNRALAVRAFLMDQGVRGTRIDVRALGASAPEGPSDRVDLQFSE